MRLTLFGKECKTIGKSVVYLVFCIVVVLFYVTQFNNEAESNIAQAQNASAYDPGNPLMPPPENAENYGSKPAEIPEAIMLKTIESLSREYAANQYTTYPIGFYKNVKLNDREQEEMESILKEISGLPSEAFVLQELTDEDGVVYWMRSFDEYRDGIVLIPYETFLERMARVDEILGGGSFYQESILRESGSEPLSYEEKWEEYETFIYEDRITGAYARYFCDYMIITIALFGVFVPVAFLLRDKRAKVNELIDSRNISSVTLIGVRYAALVVMTLLPVFLLSFIPLCQLMVFAGSNGLPADGFAFVKTIVCWLLPTLMTVTGVAFVFTILTDTPVGIAVQFVWSLISVMTGSLKGRYGMNLIVRHNAVGNLQIYRDDLSQFAINRVFYAAAAIVLVALAAWIYEQKRRGRLHGGGILRKVLGNR